MIISIAWIIIITKQLRERENWDIEPICDMWSDKYYALEEEVELSMRGFANDCQVIIIKHNPTKQCHAMK